MLLMNIEWLVRTNGGAPSCDYRPGSGLNGFPIQGSKSTRLLVRLGGSRLSPLGAIDLWGPPARVSYARRSRHHRSSSHYVPCLSTVPQPIYLPVGAFGLCRAAESERRSRISRNVVGPATSPVAWKPRRACGKVQLHFAPMSQAGIVSCTSRNSLKGV